MPAPTNGSDPRQFVDTITALNNWHLEPNTTGQSEQTHQLLMARRVSSPSKINAFAQPSTAAMTIEKRHHEERIRHGSTDALAMLRSSSATSDGLAATLEGCAHWPVTHTMYPFQNPCRHPSPPSSSCASLSTVAMDAMASPDRRPIRWTCNPAMSPAPSTESMGLERMPSLAEKLLEAEATSPDTMPQVCFMGDIEVVCVSSTTFCADFACWRFCIIGDRHVGRACAQGAATRAQRARADVQVPFWQLWQRVVAHGQSAQHPRWAGWQRV